MRNHRDKKLSEYEKPSLAIYKENHISTNREKNQNDQTMELLWLCGSELQMCIPGDVPLTWLLHAIEFCLASHMLKMWSWHSDQGLAKDLVVGLGFCY